MPTITTVDAAWTSGITLDEAELRRAETTSFLGDGSNNGVRGGIVRHGDNSLAVAVNGSDQITVQSGAFVIPGATGLGVYRGSLPATTSAVGIAARNSTNPRIDLVVIQIVSGQAQVRTVDGTASSSPSAPALPANAIEIARLNVPRVANGAVVVDTSWRTYATGLGGDLYVESAARLPGSGNQKGQRAIALDTGAEHIWTGTAWVMGNRTGTYTPNTVNLPSALNYARYVVANTQATVWAVWTATSTGGGVMTIPLPFPADTSSAFLPIGIIRGVRQGVTNYTGTLVLEGANTARPTTADGTQWSGTVPATWQNGDIIGCTFTYPLDV